jgi:hypothetical protein
LQIERQTRPQGALLSSWLEEHVPWSFADRFLPVDMAVAHRSGSVSLSRMPRDVIVPTPVT